MYVRMSIGKYYCTQTHTSVHILTCMYMYTIFHTLAHVSVGMREDNC